MTAAKESPIKWLYKSSFQSIYLNTRNLILRKSMIYYNKINLYTSKKKTKKDLSMIKLRKGKKSLFLLQLLIL